MIAPKMTNAIRMIAVSYTHLDVYKRQPLHREDPWYYVDEVTYPFATPEYRFDEGSFRRMNYLDGGGTGTR